MGNLPPWLYSLQRLCKTSFDFLQQGRGTSYTSRSESNGRRLGYSIFHVQSQSLERYALKGQPMCLQLKQSSMINRGSTTSNASFKLKSSRLGHQTKIRKL